MAKYVIISTLAIVGMIMALGMGIGSEHVQHLKGGMDIIKELAEHAAESAGGLAAAVIAIYSIVKIFKGNPAPYEKPERRILPRKQKQKKVPVIKYIVYGSVATLIVIGIIVASVVIIVKLQ